ncbi:MAG: NAD(P)H-dependent glycerol-3-phosphate dehydrogenase [Pseudomonadota bacterium]
MTDPSPSPSPAAPPGPKTAEPYPSITVIGHGSWGTALAATAARAGREVRLWGRRPEVTAEINAHATNSTYLPEAALPDGITATDDIAAAVAAADAVLLVTPSKSLREMCTKIAPDLKPGTPVVLCAKGIEIGTGLLLHEVAAECLPGHPIGALSGPTFAKETVLGYPTAVTIAFDFTYEDRISPEESPAARMAVSLGSETFRPYISHDLIGVEIGGAVKNVIAIACGMMTGAGFAENTRAALITRGMDEMKSLAQAMGGSRETVTGLSGAGDLTLTCSSQTSRNMSLGVQLGSGLARSDCFEGRPVVVEGEVNAVSVVDLARRIGIDMPIATAVHAILHEGADLAQAFAELWARPIRSEHSNLDVELAHPASPDDVRRFADTIR